MQRMNNTLHLERLSTIRSKHNDPDQVRQCLCYNITLCGKIWCYATVKLLLCMRGLL